MASENTRSLLAFKRIKLAEKLILSANTLNIPVFQAYLHLYKSIKKDNPNIDSDLSEAIDFSDTQIEKALSLGHKIISIFDDEYPESLKNIANPPPILFCNGNINLLKKDCLAVVGSRNYTEHGSIITQKITTWFTNHDWCIVSGLAKGVDSRAHISALDAGGSTIAVLAHGLETTYPKENELLAENIVKNNGLLISESPYYTDLVPSNFIRRNRIQSGLSKATILTQSHLNSGSVYTAKKALMDGRFLVVAKQSEYDTTNKKEIVSANLFLLNESDENKADILSIDKQLTCHILPLQTSQDYSIINDKIRHLSFEGKKTLF